MIIAVFIHQKLILATCQFDIFIANLSQNIRRSPDGIDFVAYQSKIKNNQSKIKNICKKEP